jgi:hypothetical protein
MKALKKRSISIRHVGLITAFLAFEIFIGASSVQAGTVGLFLDCSTGGETDVFGDIAIETDGKANVLILPELEQGKVINSYSSPDYASNTISSYTVDGRLFFKRKWSSGTVGITERDPQSFQVINGFSLNENPGASEFRFAVVGNQAYYHNNREWDILAGDIGGQFKVYDFETTVKETLLEWGDDDNIGDPFSDSGNLYSIVTERIDADRSSIQFFKRDLTSGILSEVIGSFLFTGLDGYQFRWDYAVDDGAVYWPVVRTSDKQVEIWRYTFGDELPELIFAAVVSDKLQQINKIDVDNGQILLTLYEDSDDPGGYSGNVLWYNTLDDEWSLIDTGLHIFDAEILYYETPPVIDTPEDTSEEDDGNDNTNDDSQHNSDGDSGGGGGCFIFSLLG